MQVERFRKTGFRYGTGTYFGRIILRKHRWKDTFLQPFAGNVFVFTAIEKDVLFSRMAMKVTVENQFGFMHESKANIHSNPSREIFREKPFDHFSRMPNGWIGILENGFIISIQISTGQGTSVVSNDHSIRIEHRNNFKDKVIAQKLNTPTSIVLVCR